jgi:thioredoxin-related protein
MKNKFLMACGLLLILGIFVLAQAGDPTEGSKKITYLTFEEGLKKARADSLHIAVFFETSWCGWCKKMHQTTLKDPRVIELLTKDFVPVMVDGDKRRDLTKAYNVRGFPATWFLKSDSTRIAPAPGFWPADDFYWLLRYIKEDAYEKVQFKEYVETTKKKEG